MRSSTSAGTGPSPPWAARAMAPMRGPSTTRTITATNTKIGSERLTQAIWKP